MNYRKSKKIAKSLVFIARTWSIEDNIKKTEKYNKELEILKNNGLEKNEKRSVLGGIVKNSK